MKTLTIILATIFCLATAGLGALAARRSLSDASSIDELYGAAKAEVDTAAKQGHHEAQELQALGGKTGMLRAGGIVFGVAALAALVLMVVTFRGRRVAQFAGGLVVLAAAAIVINPDYNLGPFAPASARQLAYVVAALAALGALAAWGSAKLRGRASRAAA